ncbi:hypothetical protein QR680_010199 [Steinernema hermaphroditum]|uniref:Uncharacterized protein n=1 Tax=Steinernema hermaphroditum TaxID=289476 RepID=A0AA39IQR7_9BILA|nr:hypothetical protein QR680_010199 [Steinernema hermaphroditum]
MSPLQTIVGCTYMSLPLILLPAYLRIVYIYATRTKYKSLECYRIMIHIGVIQCAMGPGVFLYGLMQLLDYDPWNIGTYTMRVMSSAVRMEAVMSLVLALNRLKVICDLHYPDWIHTAILTLVWILGTVNYVLLYTPWFGYGAQPGVFSSHYDFTKPYSFVLQQIGSYFMVSSFGLSLIVYMTIIIYLLRLRARTGLTSNFDSERHVLIYAGIRFVIDISLAIVFNYGHLPAIPEVDFPVLLGYVLNNFLLPPALYLILNKTLRTEFFNRDKKQTNDVYVLTPSGVIVKPKLGFAVSSHTSHDTDIALKSAKNAERFDHRKEDLKLRTKTDDTATTLTIEQRLDELFNDNKWTQKPSTRRSPISYEA